MLMKSKRILLIAGATLVIALGSCVSKKKYVALQDQYNDLNRDYTAMQVALAESLSLIHI